MQAFNDANAEPLFGKEWKKFNPTFLRKSIDKTYDKFIHTRQQFEYSIAEPTIAASNSKRNMVVSEEEEKFLLEFRKMKLEEQEHVKTTI